MFSIAEELMKTRRELRELKEQLHTVSQLNTSKQNFGFFFIQLQSDGIPPSSEILNMSPISTISLFVQYNGFFNESCDILRTMTVEELMVCMCEDRIQIYIFFIKQVKLRQIAGIDSDYPIRLRVLSEDGLTTLFFLDREPDRTLESYDEELKPRMILNIEDDNEINSKRNQFQRAKSMSIGERTYSYESDV